MPVPNSARWWLAASVTPYVAAALLGSKQSPPTSYVADVAPVMKVSCVSCHGGAKPAADLNLSSVAGLRKAIKPGDPEHSSLIRRMKGLDGKPQMPMGFKPIDNAAIAKIEGWIKAGAPAPDPSVDFDRDVLGVFKSYCVTCHAGAGAPANLDLSTAKGIAKGGVSGPLIKPGKPDESLLIHRLMGLDGKPQMPKGFSPISKAKMDGLRRWIASGGSTEGSNAQHWAYVAPVSPAMPKLKDQNWVRNPIDAFVLDRLVKEGLKPSPEAGKEVLLRRVSLDLTGLPPTLEEMDSFLKDKSPNAYEKVVDRLLASPHYGERQARIWLDLARYADTNGYEADRSRTAYLYRDWVIQAFNKNEPYDRFTIDQLAGDLEPGATLDERVATGFHRNSMWNEEGGVDANESMFETVLDRVGTTATVFMGSTMACARCHDHKFDPFKQKDFYKMYAFFANNRYSVEGDYNQGQRKFYEPVIPVPTAEQSEQTRALKEQISALKQKVKANPVDVGAWTSAAKSVVWAPLTDPSVSTDLKGEFKLLDDGSFVQTSSSLDRDNYHLQARLPSGTWTGLRLQVLPDDSFPLKGPGRATSGNFLLTKCEVFVAGKPVDWKVQASYTQSPYNLTGLKEGVNENGGWAVYPEAGKPNELVLAFDKPIPGDVPVKVTLGMQSPTWPQHTIGRFKVTVTQADDPERYALTSAERSALAVDKPSKEQVELLAKHATKFDPVASKLAGLESELNALSSKIPTAMVLSEKSSKGAPTAPIHIRGEFLNTGDLVQAGTPEFLPAMPKSLPDNRLGLAKWLFLKTNPLTARVQVNRMWASYFGRGIVETEEDFGTQCSPPTHPKVLDWLACQLRDKGWNLKAVHRLIVTSATYRQSSDATAKLIQRDPLNELLARGPRFRMEAEMIRDTALRASGLLNEEVGGPSVMPYQPDGIWDSPYSGERWRNVMGKEQYRRGLYVYWKRTAPYPSFMALDASSREACTVRRVRTNTPLQALALMNDKAYVEAARALAARTAAAKGDASRAAMAFRLCTGRTPKPEETQRLVRLANTMRARYRSKPDEAKRLLGATKGDLTEQAAWTMVGNVLLNLDETLTKE